MTGSGSNIDRRGLMRACGALSLLGTLPAPLLAQSQARGLSDAHVHLFNASDLPIGGFVQFVFLPSWLQSLPLLARSLARTVSLARGLAVTAEKELAGLAGAPESPSNMLVDRLSVELERAATIPSAERRDIVERLARTEAPRQAVDLQESYVALALALRSSESEAGADAAGRLLASPGSGSAYEEVVNVDPRLLERVAEGEWDGGRSAAIAAAAPEEVQRLFAQPARARGGCPEEPSSQTNGSWGARARATLKWASDMTRSRQDQLDAYLDQMTSREADRPLLVNLLVDYDRWLADRPAPGSSHGRQIQLWTRLAERNREKADVRTFAGFDPLRHAEDRLGGDDSFWRQLKLAFRNSRSPGAGAMKISGFKLYPPMGFRPLANVAEDFETDDEAMRLVRDRWRQSPALRGKSIHEELNRTLADFFAFCAGEGAPVLAHGRHSNDAGKCWGSRGNPLYWVEVVRANPALRLCLGHFAEAADFNAGMAALDAGQTPHRRIWALHGLAELLKLNREIGAQVYADIGYMSELLIEGPAGARLAADFFRRLGDYCDRYDPRCEHLMFGSDWVMLGREVNNERYLETVRRGIDLARWSDERRDNFLVNNLRRFLGVS